VGTFAARLIAGEATSSRRDRPSPVCRKKRRERREEIAALALIALLTQIGKTAGKKRLNLLVSLCCH
jgi:hypothetical protein